jgi:hypothetical protein
MTIFPSNELQLGLRVDFCPHHPFGRIDSPRCFACDELNKGAQAMYVTVVTNGVVTITLATDTQIALQK